MTIVAWLVPVAAELPARSMPGNVLYVLRFAARVVQPRAAGAAESSARIILIRVDAAQNAPARRPLWLARMPALDESARITAREQ